MSLAILAQESKEEVIQLSIEGLMTPQYVALKPPLRIKPLNKSEDWLSKIDWLNQFDSNTFVFSVTGQFVNLPGSFLYSLTNEWG